MKAGFRRGLGRVGWRQPECFEWLFKRRIPKKPSVHFVVAAFPPKSSGPFAGLQPEMPVPVRETAAKIPTELDPGASVDPD